jgi:4-aminobutyrate--pyruvate transaminase
MFGSDTYGLRPDLLTTAKGLSSGYAPISAVMVNEKVYAAVAANSGEIGTFGHGFTYSGHPVSCAIALETLKIYEEDDVVGHVKALSPKFMAALKGFQGRKYVGEVRGIGLVAAVELYADPAERTPFDPSIKAGARFAEIGLTQGLIVRALGDAVVLCPPLIITPEELDELFARFERTMALFEGGLA